MLLGALTSFAADWLPGFTELSPRAKRLYWLIVPLLIPLAAVGVSALLQGKAISGDAVFGALVVWASIYTGSQVAHTRKL